MTKPEAKKVMRWGTRRFFCVHCGLTRRRPGGFYCCCLPNEEMIRRNKNPNRCPQCHLSYTD